MTEICWAKHFPVQSSVSVARIYIGQNVEKLLACCLIEFLKKLSLSKFPILFSLAWMFKISQVNEAYTWAWTNDFSYCIGVYYKLTIWPAPSWLDSSIGRALHWHRRGHGFESCSSLIFFRLSLCNCLSCIKLITPRICLLFNLSLTVQMYFSYSIFIFIYLSFMGTLYQKHWRISYTRR